MRKLLPLLLWVSFLSAKELVVPGAVEPFYENLPIYAPYPSTVLQVYVKQGDRLYKGQMLFLLDDKDLKKQLAVIQANVALAKARVHLLQERLSRLKAVRAPKIITSSEVKNRESEIAVAEADQKRDEAQAKQIQYMIEQMTVRSPIKGIVIQNQIQPGQFLQAGKGPAVFLNDLNKLQIRIALEDESALDFNPKLPAIALFKTTPETAIPLQFYRMEPRLSLNDEKPVTEIFYSFDAPKDVQIFLGQTIEVQIGMRP